MPKLNAKTKRGDAERAAVHYCHEEMKCVITRRAIRTKFQSVDFFAADVVGKRADGSHVYVQVTAGGASAVTARRRKLEVIPWHATDKVQLLQLIQTEDPANGKRKLWFFRVHIYAGDVLSGVRLRHWTTMVQAVPVPREWFKARPK